MASAISINTISKNSGTIVQLLDPLGLATYTTTERDALTSVAGDCIYNSTIIKGQFFDGTNWSNL